MSTEPDINYPLSLGYLARIQRCHRRLSPEELAEKASVLVKDIYSLENNKPLHKESKYRLLKELWAGQANLVFKENER
jgi:hypothetical protein